MWSSPMTKSLDPIVVAAILAGFPGESLGPVKCGFACYFWMPEAWTTEVSWYIYVCICTHTYIYVHIYICIYALLPYASYVRLFIYKLQWSSKIQATLQISQYWLKNKCDKELLMGFHDAVFLPSQTSSSHTRSFTTILENYVFRCKRGNAPCAKMFCPTNAFLLQSNFIK